MGTSHSAKQVLFRQLVDGETSTYTYLLADKDTKAAVLIGGPNTRQLFVHVALVASLCPRTALC